MFYRIAGIQDTSYQADARLWQVPFDRLQLVLVVAFLASLPLWLSDLYLIGYALPWLIWAMAALGLNLLMGGAGQIHLGFGAVMAIGAYTAVHSVLAGVPFWIALLLAGLSSSVIGLVFGAAALRVKGIYLAFATLAMQTIVDFLISHVPAISGGSQASIVTPQVSVFGLAIDSVQKAYVVVFLLTGLVALFMLNVRRTAFGRALAAVREKDYAAEVIGVDTFRFKLLAFWVSSFIGGVAGAALVFLYVGSISPEQFGVHISIQLIAMVLVGGLGSVLGSFLGAGFIVFVPILIGHLIDRLVAVFQISISGDLLAHVPHILYGLMIIGFLLFEPLGLARIYASVRKYFMVWPFRNAKS